MGFTKIYKQTMPTMDAMASPNFNDYQVNLPYKDWTGTEYTGFHICGSVGSSSPYTNLIGRPSLLAATLSSPAQVFTLPNTELSGTTSGASATYFAIGSGDTAESETDYHLANAFTYNTDFTASLSFISPYYDSGNDKVGVGRTVSITAVRDITIKELGLYTRIWRTKTSSTTFSFSPAVLMYRKVLSTPISLLAGQTITLDLRITGG